jgi:hypothetical protein
MRRKHCTAPATLKGLTERRAILAGQTEAVISAEVLELIR